MTGGIHVTDLAQYVWDVIGSMKDMTPENAEKVFGLMEHLRPMVKLDTDLDEKASKE